MSTGAPLNLTLYAQGTHSWDFDPNFTIINSAIQAMQAQIATLMAGAGTVGPAGPVGMVYAGTWSSSVAYVITNVVYYSGSSYFAIAASTNQRPDLYPNTWVPLALMGAAGPAGPTGPAGAAGSGGGSTVNFPIAVAEGGTGATTAPAALAALGAAANGANADITSMSGLEAGTVRAGTIGLLITSPGGSGNAIFITNGVPGTSIALTTDGIIYCNQLQMSGSILAGTIQAAGGLISNQLSNATPGLPVTIDAPAVLAYGATIIGPAPTAPAGELALGANTSTTAVAGGVATLPATVLGFLVFNYGGANIRVPFYG
jgi:hypothetical protein